MLTSVTCQGYRAFSKSTKIDLAGITVLFGKNNSGKTTLVRLPIFIAASLASSVRTYATGWNDLRFGSSFRDLASSDQAHPRISFTISSTDPDASAEISYQAFATPDMNESVEVVGLTLDGQIVLSQDTSGDLFGENAHNKTWHFVTDSLATQDQVLLRSHRSSMQELSGLTMHAPSVRPTVQPVYESREPTSWGLSEAPYWIAASNQLEDAVSSWCEEHLDGRAISVEQAAFAFRLMVDGEGGSTNLANAGRGTQAVSSLVTMLQGVALGIHRPKLLIVEEPEAHVHPSAHGALADLLIRCASKTQVIVETHSENLILRLRRRVAEGLKPELVSLIYVDMDHQILPVTLDVSGGASHWPSGVFEYDIEEAEHIVEAKIAAMQDR